jgi:hypothetical protein
MQSQVVNYYSVILTRFVSGIRSILQLHIEASTQDLAMKKAKEGLSPAWKPAGIFFIRRIR